MRLVIWFLLIVLILSIVVVIVQQITTRTEMNQKYEVCRVDAEALRTHEWIWSCAPFVFLYWLLSRLRSRIMGPLERLLLATFVTIALFGFVFWAWMTTVFHNGSDCANAPLPFSAFVSAWISPIPGIAIVIIAGLIWNYLRVNRVAPKEA
jgi:hypothetical protein